MRITARDRVAVGRLDPSESQISCEIDAWEAMLDGVRRQSARFWSERALPVPDWWEQIPLVPFRELCADELSQVSAVLGGMLGGGMRGGMRAWWRHACLVAACLLATEPRLFLRRRKRKQTPPALASQL